MAQTHLEPRLITCFYAANYKFDDQHRDLVIKAFENHTNSLNARCIYNKNDQIFEISCTENRAQTCFGILKSVLAQHIAAQFQGGEGLSNFTRINEISSESQVDAGQDAASNSFVFQSSWVPRNSKTHLDAFFTSSLVRHLKEFEEVRLSVNSEARCLVLEARSEDVAEIVEPKLNELEVIFHETPLVEHVFRLPAIFTEEDKLRFSRLKDLVDGSLGRILLPDDFPSKDENAFSRTCLLKMMKFDRKKSSYCMFGGDTTTKLGQSSKLNKDIFSKNIISEINSEGIDKDKVSSNDNTFVEEWIRNVAVESPKSPLGPKNVLNPGERTESQNSVRQIEAEENSKYSHISGTVGNTISPSAGVKEGTLIDIEDEMPSEFTSVSGLGNTDHRGISQAESSRDLDSGTLMMDRLALEEEDDSRTRYRTSGQRRPAGSTKSKRGDRAQSKSRSDPQKALNMLKDDWNAQQAQSFNDMQKKKAGQGPHVTPQAFQDGGKTEDLQHGTNEVSGCSQMEDMSKVQDVEQHSRTWDSFQMNNFKATHMALNKNRFARWDGPVLRESPQNSFRQAVFRLESLCARIPEDETIWRMQIGRVLVTDVPKSEVAEYFDRKSLATCLKRYSDFETRHGAFSPKLTSSSGDILNLLAIVGVGDRPPNNVQCSWEITVKNNNDEEFLVIRDAVDHDKPIKICQQSCAIGMVYFHHPAHVWDCRFIVEVRANKDPRKSDSINQMMARMVAKRQTGERLPSLSIQEGSDVRVQKVKLIEKFTWCGLPHPGEGFCFSVKQHSEFTLYRPSEVTATPQTSLQACPSDKKTMIENGTFWYEATVQPFNCSTKSVRKGACSPGQLEALMESIIPEMNGIGISERGPAFEKEAQLQAEREKAKDKKIFYW